MLFFYAFLHIYSKDEKKYSKNNSPKIPALSAENKIVYGCNFFCEENFNSQSSFSVFFYACGKKMANYANFAFPLPLRYFFIVFPFYTVFSKYSKFF